MFKPSLLLWDIMHNTIICFVFPSQFLPLDGCGLHCCNNIMLINHTRERGDHWIGRIDRHVLFSEGHYITLSVITYDFNLFGYASYLSHKLYLKRIAVPDQLIQAACCYTIKKRCHILEKWIRSNAVDFLPNTHSRHGLCFACSQSDLCSFSVHRCALSCYIYLHQCDGFVITDVYEDLCKFLISSEVMQGKIDSGEGGPITLWIQMYFVIFLASLIDCFTLG